MGFKMIEAVPKSVVWHDLAKINRWSTTKELLHPLPWLVGSIALYTTSFWPLGAFASFMFFLCALRLNHEAIHNNLGLSRRGDHLVLTGLSALMLGSNHSVAYGHLRHHAQALGPGDFEGRAGDMSFWQVITYGPRFPVDILRHAWVDGGAGWRRWILIDGGAIFLVFLLAVVSNWPALWLHLLAMAVAQCLTAFFAVWITHRGCKEAGIEARSQRGPLAFLAYMMFYHREHHLFPKVPVSHLPKLARRLDQTVPGYAQSHLPIVPGLDMNSTQS